VPNAYGCAGHSDAYYIAVKCQNHTLVVEAMVALILIDGECMLLTLTTKQNTDESTLLRNHQFAVLVITQIGLNLIILPRTSLQCTSYERRNRFHGKSWIRGLL